MKRIRMLAIVLTIGVLLPLTAFSQIRATVALTPETQIAQADAALRAALASAMEAVARRFGMAIDASDMIYVSRDDVIIANAGEASFHLPARSSSSAVQVVELGLIYLSEEGEVRFGDGVRGRIPAGFHAMRVRISSATTMMEAYDEAGRIVARLPVALGPPTTARKLTASLEVDVENQEATGCVDWHGKKFSAELCLTFSL